MYENETVQERYIRQNAEAQALGYPSYAAYLEGTKTAPWLMAENLDGGGGLQPGAPGTMALGVPGHLEPGAEVSDPRLAGGTISDIWNTLVSLLPWAGGPSMIGGGQVTAAGLVGKTISGGGIAGGIATGLAAAYGASQLLGVQYPWETGPGEGFIAPWTPKVKDENDKWVSSLTRPDLFGGAQALGTIDGKPVVKSWKAGGWPFSMTQDGMIYTFNKSGVLKKWKPKKPIVLVRGSISLKNAVKAQRLLDKQWRIVARRVKALKLA